MSRTQLLEQYAPLVFLHSEEDYFPSSIDFYLKHVKLVDPAGGSSISGPSYEQLADARFHEKKNWYLEVADPASCYPGEKPDGSGVGNGCYAYVQETAETLFLYYSFFYPFNGSILDDKQNQTAFKLFQELEKVVDKFSDRFHHDTSGLVDLHEGDWEHIIVGVSRSTGKPDKVYVSAHAGGEVVSWDRIAKYERTDHPTIYSARHSHACYSTIGGPDHEHTDKSLPPPFNELPAGATVHDLTNEGTAWKTWADSRLVVVPYDRQGPTADGFDKWETPGQEWLKYSGLWGRKWPKDAPISKTSGPPGPAYHREWPLGHPDGSYGN